MLRVLFIAVVTALLGASIAAAQTPKLSQAESLQLFTAADKTAALRAAGFTSRSGKWTSGEGECEAFIEPGGVRDLNGDGKPEVIITESGTFCYGNTGQGFYLMERTRAGAWRKVYQSQGIPEIQTTKGVGGWADIEVGGPGFCFPIVRYDGKTYVMNRRKEYQPGACSGR